MLTLPKAITCHPHIEPVFHEDLSIFEFYKTIESFYKYYESDFEKDKVVMLEKVKAMLSYYPVVIFIKGTPHDPFCKFSKQFIEMVKKLEIRYKSYNIFKDEKFKGWLKIYSGWKTFPQFFVNGKVIGGVDVLQNLINENKIYDIIPEECQKKGAVKDIQKMLSKNQTVLFGEVSKLNKLNLQRVPFRNPIPEEQMMQLIY